MSVILGVLKHALMITSFVLVMMLLIEYINVQTRGSWQHALRKSRSGQILLGAVLGATPEFELRGQHINPARALTQEQLSS